MNDFQGRFLWYELMTTDTGKGAKFYTSLLGWTTEAWDNEMGPYTMFVNGETPMAGMMVLPAEAKVQGAPPNWLGYTGVADVDATVSRVQSLGGRVVAGPMDIPTVGRIAVLADPQGAVFAVYTPLEPAPSEGMPPVGNFAWHELGTTDPDAALAFYSDIFGWEILIEHHMGGGTLYKIFGKGGSPPLGGMYAKPPERPGPPAWLYYVLVDDVATLVPRVTALGGRVLNGPMEVPDGGVVAQCLDPQGAAFALYSNATRDR